MESRPLNVNREVSFNYSRAIPLFSSTTMWMLINEIELSTYAHVYIAQYVNVTYIYSSMVFKKVTLSL